MTDVEDMREWVQELDSYLNDEKWQHHHKRLQKAKEFILEELIKPAPLLSVSMVFLVSACILPLYEEMKLFNPEAMKKIDQESAKRVREKIRACRNERLFRSKEDYEAAKLANWGHEPDEWIGL